jgi:hypothetical protein
MLSEEIMTGSRKGKMQIGGHFDPRDVFTLQEVLAHIYYINVTNEVTNDNFHEWQK